MYRLFVKRLLDIVISILLLPFVLLDILLFAPIIWLTDRGAVFYNAERVGKKGKRFKMFKLRSMYMNSPDLRTTDGSTYNSNQDERVTPIGRLLRKTSLDELPQIVNVLVGEMSIIGPRPKLYNPAKEYNLLADGDIKRSYDVQPGITGYAQAFFRNSITQEEKYHWDAYYADHLSFMLDCRIIIKTISTVLLRENINNA